MPYDTVSGAPMQMRRLTVGGKMVTLTSLSQINDLARYYDQALPDEKAGRIKSAMAIAKTRFNNKYTVKDGKVVQRADYKKKD